MKYKKHGTCLKCNKKQDLLWWLRVEFCGKCMDIDRAMPKEYQKSLIRLAEGIGQFVKTLKFCILSTIKREFFI